MKARFLKWPLRVLGVLVTLYALLLVPDRTVPVPGAPDKKPFAWNRDAYWSALESRFKEARSESCADLSDSIARRLARADSFNAVLQVDTLTPEAPIFNEIEANSFELAVLLAACPARVGDYVKSFGELRQRVKRQSAGWDMNSEMGRDRIYRQLYGGRVAIEEVIQQSAPGLIPETVVERNEPSAAPSATIMGVVIHSGDILVSRGGAPTSALIARGSDYPGNFSHVALVYVDETTGVVAVIESHIEKGVALATIPDYLKDTKLRIMVLRPRADLPAVQADPMLPHKVARYMFELARSGHIPYDFPMDTRDASKMFCSEVAAHAYDHLGVELWNAPSRISSAGARNWLSAFGVRNFATQEPSDLEYDPQLCVVAEWRSAETLFKDRLDNAVIDVMLENADSGATLRYEWYMLPVARALKLYSMILNRFDAIGPVPEGMTATAALKNQWFSRRHRDTVAALRALTHEFRQRNGYAPPYWELVKLAREAYRQRSIQ